MLYPKYRTMYHFIHSFSLVVYLEILINRCLVVILLGLLFQLPEMFFFPCHMFFNLRSPKSSNSLIEFVPSLDCDGLF